MNIWIIKDGDKAGPFPDYEIRSMIEAGEIDGDTPAWHDRLSDWKTIADLDLFENELKPAPRPTPPPIPAAPLTNPHLIRRFWARWLDLYLFGGIWWLAMWAAGRDIGMLLTNPWIMLGQYVPWFALEAYLIHRFATTPGKWLLGIRVLNLDGSHLSLPISIRRASRVLFIGIGFGVQPFSLICMLLGYFSTRKLGQSLWDRAGGHFLDCKPLHPARISTYALALFFSIWLQVIVLTPYIIESAGKSMSPEQVEILKNNPPWHLPKRK